MLKKIKENKRENYGHNELIGFVSFFEELLRKYRLPSSDIQDFGINNLIKKDLIINCTYF